MARLSASVPTCIFGLHTGYSQYKALPLIINLLPRGPSVPTELPADRVRRNVTVTWDDGLSTCKPRVWWEQWECEAKYNDFFKKRVIISESPELSEKRPILRRPASLVVGHVPNFRSVMVGLVALSQLAWQEIQQSSLLSRTGSSCWKKGVQL